MFDLGAKLNPPLGEWFKFYDFTKNATRYYRTSITQYLEGLTGTPATLAALMSPSRIEIQRSLTKRF